MQTDRNGELAHAFQRLSKMDLAAIDFLPDLFELLRDVGRGDGAEQVVPFAGFAVEGELDAFKLLRQQLGSGLLFRRAAYGGSLHLVNYGAVARRGFNR